MNKPLTAINRKLDEFIRSIERIKGRAAFIEHLREMGFQGEDSQVLRDYKWLMLKKGEKEEPEPKEPEMDDEEEDENDE